MKRVCVCKHIKWQGTHGTHWIWRRRQEYAGDNVALAWQLRMGSLT